MTSDSSESNSKPGLGISLRKIFNRKNKKNSEIYDARAYEDLDTPRQDMIKGIFQLSDLNARDIMIPRVDIIAIESDIELKPLAKLVVEAGHSRLPVFEETIDNIVGILYVKDLLNLLIDKSKKFNLKKNLNTPYFVPETMRLDELLFEFQKRKLHLAIVVDEYGGVAGIVTLEDILEEIVGDIEDEFDSATLPELEKTGPNNYEVDSRMTITDFNNELNQKLPTDDFDTIGGFILDLFGRIPEKDETASYKNITFRIKDINGTIINRIIVKISKPK